MTSIKNEIIDSIKVKVDLLADENVLLLIKTLAKECLSSLKNGGKIILAGNGGSFADAQHISAEFISKYMIDRDSLPSICLGTNNSAITAIANDYGYNAVFSRELSSIGNKNDICIFISTSGNSANIIEAVKVAEKKEIKSYAFTGETGGQLNVLCQCIKVPSLVTGRIQECHILIGHIICGIIEKEYFETK